MQGKRYSLKEFQDAACAAAAKRFGGLHGCLPVRTLEVRPAACLVSPCMRLECWRCRPSCSLAACWAAWNRTPPPAAPPLLPPPPSHPGTAPRPAAPPQREYWREREKAAGAPVLVEYGNDVDGSLFAEEDRLGATRWNLNVSLAGPLGATLVVGVVSSVFTGAAQLGAAHWNLDVSLVHMAHDHCFQAPERLVGFDVLAWEPCVS